MNLPQAVYGPAAVGMRRLRALVFGLSPEARAWPTEPESAAKQAPALKLGRAAQLIGG